MRVICMYICAIGDIFKAPDYETQSILFCGIRLTNG